MTATLANVLVFISGNENTRIKDTKGGRLDDSPAFILLHELLGHAIPFITESDTGNAVDNENKARKEIREKDQKGESPLRKAEPGHKE